MHKIKYSVDSGETHIEAITRSVERKTRTRCYTCRLDSWTESGIEFHRATFVCKRQLPGGGYPVAFEARFTVNTKQ